MRLHEKIRQIIETTHGLTQKGLAERMGLNPAAVNRMLYGRRHIMAEEVPIIENYLGVSLDTHALHAAPDHASARSLPAKDATGDGKQALRFQEDVMIPVFGGAPGGEAGFGLDEKNIVDWMPRHPSQFGLKDAFAVYMPGEEMEPRYMQGELAYVHPGRVPERGRDCLVVLKTGEAFIRRYMGQTEKAVRVLTFNPEKEYSLAKTDVKTIYTIIGRG